MGVETMVRGFRDGCEECRVLRAKTGMNWGVQTGSDMERWEHSTHSSAHMSLHTPHLSAPYSPYIYSLFANLGYCQPKGK